MKIHALLLLLLHGVTCFQRDYNNRLYYTVKTTNPNIAQLAATLDARYEGQVGELKQHHWISIPKSSPHITRRFHKRDMLLSPQIPSRHRLFKRAPPPPTAPVLENTEEEYKLNNQTPPLNLPLLTDTDGYARIKTILNITDPGFDQQWHLLNRNEMGHDVNVTGVWSQGITGKNVIVAILDDGLDMDHPDLHDNYFAEGSYDFNNHVKDPRPRLQDDTHGTRCAGEIAAVKNDICGLGVAYEAKVSGIRILSGEITEADEAAALNYAYQENHIYSCSWGPPDLGEVAEAPQGILLDAIQNGIDNGRNGTGSIYVFASGNGGANDDNCNFDGYTNSIFTITVGAVDKMGNHPYYSEKCAAQLVVTYSSGSGGYIYTTDVGENQCSERHGGTSAAAPLAAGVFALVLSVRPDLTWRDLQHLCVQSAIPISLDDDDWSVLPSGRQFNHKYGYGILDAYRIVELAKGFRSVRAQTHLSITSEIDVDNTPLSIQDITPVANNSIDPSTAFTSTLTVTKENIQKHGLSRLEHVTVTVNIEHQRRGDLEILVESPNGVSSQLGTPRKYDTSSDGLINWTFMTVKHWEESPVGNWTLRVVDGRNPEYRGQFVDWTLTLWGESEIGFFVENKTEHEKNGTRKEPTQSFMDTTNEDEKEEGSFGLYGLVSVFMLFSLASTAYVVKKYMLGTHQYVKPTEEDTYEFDNLLTQEESDED
ncbi:serine endoprotease Kex1 [Mucor mucedo]|uniref:serine endoprotease Kex1 n=1 Tax=Mucor mucedo TaxID=29922 RepID=UPI0022203238|nr:serine endoprotease Kex1 [Mucor mucedo]KAI7882315.1 serine endoprotease Kex1 [Mucor mucedo]